MGAILSILTFSIASCGGGKSSATDRQTLAALVADMNGQMPIPMEKMTLVRMTMDEDGIVYEYCLEEDGAALLATMRTERAEVETMLLEGLMKAPDTRAMVQLAVSCGRGVGYRYVDPAAPDTAFFLLPATRLAAALEKTK